MTGALLDPLTDPRWERLVDRAPDASIFHHPAWLGLLRDQYRYPLAAACALDASGEAVAGLPVAFVASRLTGRRLVSIPFSDSCPPLVAEDAGPDAAETVAVVLERERQARGVPIEVRERFEALGTPVDLYAQHIVDLRPGIEEVERAYTSQVRRNTRKAQRSGVELARRTDRDALDAFYALHLVTRRRLGVPTQPLSFIRGIGRIFDRGLGFVALASHEGRPVAAAVFLRGGSTLTYKYGASDQAALPLRPNNLIFSEAIRWACGEGLAALDLGRTDLGQEGLAAFKRSWGGQERTLAYTYAGREPAEAGHSRAEQLIGEVIQRSPPLAGRIAGELLYKHVG